MSKSRQIIDTIRKLKSDKESEFLSFTPGNFEKRAKIFEPITEKEMLAWRVGFLRGIEEAEMKVADLLYPTIDTDND